MYRVALKVEPEHFALNICTFVDLREKASLKILQMWMSYYQTSNDGKRCHE